MKVSCQACGAKYTIADDKVRGRKVKIRCKSCGTPIVVDGNAPAEPDDGASAAAPAVSIEPPAAAAGGSWSVNLSDTDQRTMTTQEIIDAWKSGVVTSDAYVWKDGMGDWVAILESVELKPLLSAPAAATNTPFAPPATPFVPPVASRSVPAARVATSRSGVDLFDASSHGSAEEDDIATSAPHLPAAGSTAYDDKPTGARNENSVLFSLDSLKGGLAPEPKKSTVPKRPGAPDASDPFAMSASNDLMSGSANPLFSMNANQALLTAPAPPEPPPPRFDATGAPAKPMNKLLVFGGAGAAAVVLLLVGLMLGRSGSKDEDATAEGSAKTAGSSESEEAKNDEKKADEKKADEKKADEEKKAEEKKAEDAKKPEAVASASATPTSTAVAAHTATPTGPKPGGGGTTKPAEKKEEPAPAQGTSPFSVSAAQVALTQAASNAGGCGKPGGPTGSGKVQVTFATSGRVTSANVAGGSFAGTSVGGCVAGVFRKARIPAFAGNPVTVSKSFSVK